MDDHSEHIASKLTVLVSPALNLIPGWGGALAAAWSEWDVRRRFRRLEDTLDAIRRKLSGLTINPGAASDEGMQLLELVLREAQIQHSERKREHLANVLVASWIANEPPRATFDESLLFLRATAMFTEAHVAVLNRLHDAGSDGSTPFAEIRDLIVDRSNPDEAALIVLNDLCSAFAFAKRAWDLNRPNAKGAILMSGNLSPEGIGRKCFHAISKRGQKYVQLILRGVTG